MTATARMIRASNVQTLWHVTVGDKAYFATTYPDAESVYLQHGQTRRPISSLQGRRVLPIIREAINRGALMRPSPSH